MELTTKRAIAQAFDVSTESVNKWTLKGDFPGGRQGPWDHHQIAQWLENRNSPKAGSRRQSRDGSLISRLTEVAMRFAESLIDEDDPFNKLNHKLPAEHLTFLRMSLLHYLIDLLEDLGDLQIGDIKRSVFNKLDLSGADAIYRQLAPRLGQKFD